MRHFFSARPFPATCPIASLALGVTVPAAPRLLVAVSGGAQRLAPGDTAAHPGAVAPASITVRADQHLALTPGAQKQSRIAHRSSPGEEDWTSREHAVILEIEPCASADLGRSPGRDLQVFKSGVASASTPETDLTRTRSRRHGHAGYAELTHTVEGTNTDPSGPDWNSTGWAEDKNAERRLQIRMALEIGQYLSLRLFAEYAHLVEAIHTRRRTRIEHVHNELWGY
jgi:hypothetical protein